MKGESQNNPIHNKISHIYIYPQISKKNNTDNGNSKNNKSNKLGAPRAAASRTPPPQRSLGAATAALGGTPASSPPLPAPRPRPPSCCIKDKTMVWGGRGFRVGRGGRGGEGAKKHENKNVAKASYKNLLMQ